MFRGPNNGVVSTDRRARSRGPRVGVVAYHRLTRDEVATAGRSGYLLTLRCGHHVIRKVDATFAQCGHCAREYRDAEGA